jgi:hypothetical protein
LLEQMTEGNMLGVVRITQQFLSNHHTIISIGITFFLFTRRNNCVKNIIAIIMECYYNHDVLFTYDLILFTLKFSALYDFSYLPCVKYFENANF